MHLFERRERIKDGLGFATVEIKFANRDNLLSFKKVLCLSIQNCRLEGLPRWLSGKESCCQCRSQFDPWSRKIRRAMEQLSPWAHVPQLRSPRDTTTEPVLEPGETTSRQPKPAEHVLSNKGSLNEGRRRHNQRAASAHCN